MCSNISTVKSCWNYVLWYRYRTTLYLFIDTGTIPLLNWVRWGFILYGVGVFKWSHIETQPTRCQNEFINVLFEFRDNRVLPLELQMYGMQFSFCMNKGRTKTWDISMRYKLVCLYFQFKKDKKRDTYCTQLCLVKQQHTGREKIKETLY